MCKSADYNQAKIHMNKVALVEAVMKYLEQQRFKQKQVVDCVFDLSLLKHLKKVMRFLLGFRASSL